MSVISLQRKTMREQVRDILLDEVTSGRLGAVGSRLPPIKSLATQFGTSFRTVQMALQELEAQGRVELRHGAGCFVADTQAGLTLHQSVVLYMETRGHIFSDLAQQLTASLQQRGRIPTSIDISDQAAAKMVARLARGGAGVFIFHGGASFPPAPLQTSMFDGRLLISVADRYDRDDARVAKVRVEHQRGGELVVEHLHAAGHQHVLLVGPKSMLAYPGNHAEGFRATCDQKGIQYSTIEIHYDADNRPTLDIAATQSLFGGPNAPTAIFGMRDFDVCSLCNVLNRNGIEIAKQCELVGYGNTPWSRGGIGGFSSVDWSIDHIVLKIIDLLDRAKTDIEGVRGTCQWVVPQLILRRADREEKILKNSIEFEKRGN